MNRQEALEAINDKLKDLKYYAKEMGEVLESANYFINELERQVKKEPKLKAYHVKDEYSYDCLMKELEEKGYIWKSGDKPIDLGVLYPIDLSVLYNVVIYLHDDKKIAYGSKREYDIRRYKKYDLVEYKKEPPKFYAKIKGWENLGTGIVYFYKASNEKIYLATKFFTRNMGVFTKEEWAELGITDENADFEEVEE